jgi:hypothetical protein
VSTLSPEHALDEHDAAVTKSSDRKSALSIRTFVVLSWITLVLGGLMTLGGLVSTGGAVIDYVKAEPAATDVASEDYASEDYMSEFDDSMAALDKDLAMLEVQAKTVFTASAALGTAFLWATLVLAGNVARYVSTD